MITWLIGEVGQGNAWFLIGFVALVVLCLLIMAGILVWEKICGRI